MSNVTNSKRLDDMNWAVFQKDYESAKLQASEIQRQTVRMTDILESIFPSAAPKRTPPSSPRESLF